MQPEQLTIPELKGRLKELNLPLNGRKVGLLGRRHKLSPFVPCTVYNSPVLCTAYVALPILAEGSHSLSSVWVRAFVQFPMSCTSVVLTELPLNLSDNHGAQHPTGT